MNPEAQAKHVDFVLKFEDDQRKFDEAGGYVAYHHWEWIKGLAARDFDQALKRVADPWHWENILSVLGVSTEIEGEFMKQFSAIDSRTARAKACGGLLHVRNLREKGILSTARELYDALGGTARIPPLFPAEYADYEGPIRIVDEHNLNVSKAKLSAYLMECAHNGDWKSLETLARLIKRGGQPEDGKGGRLSEEGRTWETFCKLHLKNKSLPSKALLRDSMVLTEDNKAEFSRWVNALGLGGLPPK